MTVGGTVLGSTLVAVFVASALALLLDRLLGRNAGYPLAVVYATGAAALGSLAPSVVGGGAVEASLPWVSSLGVRFTLRLDGLSLMFGLLVLGIGALVVAYSARYLKPGRGHGRFYGMLTFFGGSMLGLVLAGDLILLFVFWELTSIASFFLIGGSGEAEGEAKAATRALLVTGVGGLALLAGIVLLGVAAGTFDIQEAVSGAEALREHAFAPAMLGLVLVGAFTKSAQFPFHFWLPGAMVAPTPVSAYLHAATMVKAGIYLLARLSPLFAGPGPWVPLIVLTGLVTAVFGGAMALKKYDLKALLAYSTVSQLGFIVALVGVGTFTAVAAAAAHTIAHAAFKGSLFMVAGIVDHEAGTRDMRRLSGLRRAMPLTATVTALSALSMAGVPPFLGFVSKEEAFSAFLATPESAWLAPAAAALAVTASLMTFAYGARLFDGTFEGPLEDDDLHEAPRSFVAPAAVTAVAGLALGLVVFVLDPFVESVAEGTVGGGGVTDLALWHGATPAFWLSVVVIAGGTGLFVLRRRGDRLIEAIRGPVTGDLVFDRAHDAAVNFGGSLARPFLSLRPAIHLSWVLGAATVAGVLGWLARSAVPEGPAPGAFPGDLVVAALLGLAIIGVIFARNRLAAVALLGIAGFLVAVYYVLLGAPDIAITQLLIETLTVALVVLVFRRLPQSFRGVSRARGRLAAAMAAAVGTLAAVATFALTGRRPISEPGSYFLNAAEEEAGGENVVNTILVDFRALDTLGEITVLLVAAVGVFLLVHRARGGTR